MSDQKKKIWDAIIELMAAYCKLADAKLYDLPESTVKEIDDALPVLQTMIERIRDNVDSFE